MQEMRVQPLGQEDPLEEETGNPLQYSCLGNPMDRRAWQVTVHGVPKESDMTWQLNNNNVLKSLCTQAGTCSLSTYKLVMNIPTATYKLVMNIPTAHS